MCWKGVISNSSWIVFMAIDLRVEYAWTSKNLRVSLVWTGPSEETDRENKDFFLDFCMWLIVSDATTCQLKAMPCQLLFQFIFLHALMHKCSLGFFKKRAKHWENSTLWSISNSMVRDWLCVLTPGDAGISAGSRRLAWGAAVGSWASPHRGRSCSGRMDQQAGLRGERRRIPERALGFKPVCSRQTVQTSSLPSHRATRHHGNNGRHGFCWSRNVNDGSGCPEFACCCCCHCCILN